MVLISINESIAGVANACHLLYEALKVKRKTTVKEKEDSRCSIFFWIVFLIFYHSPLKSLKPLIKTINNFKFSSDFRYFPLFLRGKLHILHSKLESLYCKQQWSEKKLMILIFCCCKVTKN